MAFYVYLMTNKRYGTLYAGLTDDLVKRIYEHRTDARPGFSSRYKLKRLVWFEVHESRESAFQRERSIKKWNRAWKLELIDKANPSWRDLWSEIAN